VERLNRSMGSQASPLDHRIFNENTDINKRLSNKCKMFGNVILKESFKYIVHKVSTWQRSISIIARKKKITGTTEKITYS
jgi:hypothetical protein